MTWAEAEKEDGKKRMVATFDDMQICTWCSERGSCSMHFRFARSRGRTWIRVAAGPPAAQRPLCGSFQWWGAWDRASQVVIWPSGAVIAAKSLKEMKMKAA